MKNLKRICMAVGMSALFGWLPAQNVADEELKNLMSSTERAATNVPGY